jgi:hypothetical protein
MWEMKVCPRHVADFENNLCSQTDIAADESKLFPTTWTKLKAELLFLTKPVREPVDDGIEFSGRFALPVPVTVGGYLTVSREANYWPGQGQYDPVFRHS